MRRVAPLMMTLLLTAGCLSADKTPPGSDPGGSDPGYPNSKRWACPTSAGGR